MPNNFDFSEHFCNTVKETIKQYALAQKNANITVALSGGADSVALLVSLINLKEYNITACHLNHGIRNITAQRDEDFARELCKKLSVPFYSERADIPKLCQTQKGSVETVARNERYAFFRRASAYFGGSLIATAHTMSDNAETVLFNIVRGTSTDGVCGIPPKRDIFIRPLIKLKRADIERYLKENNRQHINDETNDDEKYSRNYLRHSVVPKLKELNPSFEEAVFRLSESARQDRSYFDIKVKEISSFNPCAKELALLPYSVFSRYVRSMVEESGGNIRLSSERLESIAQAVASTSVDGATRFISLPEKKCAVISKSGIVIEDSFKPKNKIDDIQFNIPLSIGKNIINEAYCIVLTEVYSQDAPKLPDIIKNEDIVYKLYINVEIQSAIMNKGLFARQRKEGDVFLLGGMSRKLKKVYSERHIDAVERLLLPLVCDTDGNIIATPVFSVPCDSAKCTQQDKKISLAFYRSL